MRFLPLLALALTLPADEPGVIRVSSFKDKEVTLPAPTTPPAPGEINCGTKLGGNPAPARNDSYRYATVDAEGRFSPWSDPVTIRHQQGGGVRFRYPDFLPESHEICGVLWRVNGTLALVNIRGVSLEMVGGPVWDYPRPEHVIDLQNVERFPPVVGNSLILTQKPPLPVLEPFTVPNVDLEAAYCWLGQDGAETALSPVCFCPRRPDYQGVCCRSFNLAGAQAPSGATGYRMYLRTIGGPWRWAGSFPLDVMQPQCFKMAEWSPLPANPAKSTISALQQALDARQSEEVVLVDVPVTRTAVPLIDHFGPERSRIVGPHGKLWKVEYTGGGEVALLVQSCYTTYEGMMLSGGCRATSNWAGGQAFGNRYRSCVFSGGIRTLNSSSRWEGDHTESESQFDDCFFAGIHEKGLVPIRLEGQQTANVRFRRTHIYGDGERRRGSCCLWISVPRSMVVFEGGLFGDYGHTFAILGPYASVRVDDVFIDQGTGTVALCLGVGVRMQLRQGKVNAWADANGRAPFLAKGMGEVKLEGVEIQSNLPGTFRWRMAGAVNAPVVP